MREEKLLKFIRKALKDDHLYSNEEIVYMKSELNNLEEIVKNQKKLSSKGFGN